MWFLRRGKGKHRKHSSSEELAKRLDKATEQHGQESWKVTAKATRLKTAADRMIAANQEALGQSAQRG